MVTFDKHPAGGTEHPPITIAPQSLPRRVSDREGSQLTALTHTAPASTRPFQRFDFNLRRRLSPMAFEPQAFEPKAKGSNWWIKYKSKCSKSGMPRLGCAQHTHPKPVQTNPTLHGARGTGPCRSGARASAPPTSHHRRALIQPNHSTPSRRNTRTPNLSKLTKHSTAHAALALAVLVRASAPPTSQPHTSGERSCGQYVA